MTIFLLSKIVALVRSIDHLFKIAFKPNENVIDSKKYKFFKKKFGGHKSFFVGPLIPLFWTSGDVSSGFQSQSGSFIRTWQRSTFKNI